MLNSALEINRSTLLLFKSIHILSPFLIIAKSPPTADSGEICNIDGLSEVPLCLPSPKVGRAFIPFFNNLSGGCILTTSAAPGYPTGPQPLIIKIDFSSIFNFLLLILL